jgi:hypothetical protein
LKRRGVFVRAGNNSPLQNCGKIFMTAVLTGAAVLLSACGGMPTPPPATPGNIATTPESDIATAFKTTLESQGASQQTEIAVVVAAALTGTAAPITPTADGRATLPPTWTPTFTHTPAPPTATITPSPVPPTPTITPTLSKTAICDAFYTTNNLRSGQIFAWDSKVSLYVSAVPPDATVRFVAIHHFNKESNRGADLPGGQANILQLPVKNLPQTGQYDWTLSINIKAYGEICTQSGWFIAAGRNSTRAEETSTR